MQVYVTTAAMLKWQPHMSDALTEGAFTFTTMSTACMYVSIRLG
jgi:hypothetical protein